MTFYLAKQWVGFVSALDKLFIKRIVYLMFTKNKNKIVFSGKDCAQVSLQRELRAVLTAFSEHSINHLF